MEYLAHYGVKGQRWGFRRYQNEDGTLTPEGRARYLGEANQANTKKANQTVFVSGSSKTQDKSSGYYLKKLPMSVRAELRDHMRRGDKIIVGDAPGIDRQTQDYLAKKGYTNVEVFSPGKEGARYLANPGWKQTNVDKPGAEIGSKEWLAAKDFVMSNLADKGIAVTIDDGAKATRKNVDRLVEANKDVMVYELGRDKGFVKNFLTGRSRETYFVNGKEIPEDYDESFDRLNIRGEVPKHEYGTRTRDIASSKIKEESRKAEAIAARSKSRPETSSRGTALDIISSDKQNWKTVSSKKGEREFQYIGPGKDKTGQVRSLRNAGYTYREIEQVLGISSNKIAEILS